MQALSLTRWQETADEIKSAAAAQIVIAPAGENMKMSCKILGGADASGEGFQLQCERLQISTCDAGPRAN
ncbi:MAG: hypothetical protein U1E20_13235 [Methylocystis sp.]|uniref:hypothetical protein n=1 Tax=Methylocystis sp. TaxID=1911079 RepID=UPI00395074E2